MITGPIALLASSWTIFKTNWKILAPIAITPTVMLLAGQFIGMAGGLALFLGFLVSIAGIVFAIAMAPALIDALTKIDNGSGASLRYWSQYKAGFKFFWIVLGLGILQGLIILGSAVLFIIPAIVVGGFVGMYLFARILDGHKGFSAMTESYSLVKGRWWKVFGRILCFVLVYVIAAIIVGLVDFRQPLCYLCRTGSIVTSHTDWCHGSYSDHIHLQAVRFSQIDSHVWCSYRYFQEMVDRVPRHWNNRGHIDTFDWYLGCIPRFSNRTSICIRIRFCYVQSVIV